MKVLPFTIVLWIAALASCHEPINYPQKVVYKGISEEGLCYIRTATANRDEAYRVFETAHSDKYCDYQVGQEIK